MMFVLDGYLNILDSSMHTAATYEILSLTKIK